MKWTKEENDFLINNYKNMEIKKCSELLGRNIKSIQHQVSKLRLTVNKKWSDKDIELIINKYSTIDIKNLAILLNRTEDSIRTKAYELNLKVNKKLIGERISKTKLSNPKPFDKFKVNPTQFLNIKTPEISYILGILWADGYIRNDCVYLWLKRSDAENIKNIFLRTGNWNIYYRKLKGRKEQMCFHTSNKFIYNFLVSNDYLYKSKVNQSKILSLIPKELISYFFRGYFDGDGSIYHKKSQNILNITSTYEQDWTIVEKNLVNLNINYSLKRLEYINKIGKLNRMSRIVIQNRNDIIKFCDYIYNNYTSDIIGFKRKYDVFIEILNHKN